jgi:hypothetical protein
MARRSSQSGGKTYPGGFYTGEEGDDVQPGRWGKPRASREKKDIEPAVDQWYLREDTREKFVVTVYDEQARSIEIQTADGERGEIDLNTWRAIPLVLTGPDEKFGR